MPELFAAARELCPTVSPAIRDKLKREMDDVDAGAAELSPELLAMIDNLRDMDSSSNGLAAAAIHEGETGVRLLAQKLKEKKYLFLWWD